MAKPTNFLTRPGRLLLGTLGCYFLFCLIGCSGGDERSARERPPAPVEVTAVEQGLIRSQRTFSGALEASESFAVSPKVGGRIEEMVFDLGDAVPRDAIVARLDADEFQQDLARVEAELMVARANFVEAESSLMITQRAIGRSETLRERGVASEAELDQVRSELLAQQARVEVFRAEIARAEAAVEYAKIRVDYTHVRAQWRGSNESRLVARRYADEGQNISANEDLLQIVAIDPVMAVFYVTERDYPSLQINQQVDIHTDAFPGRIFVGRIARIAPVFQEASRQARIEVQVPNAERSLKPGMFVRADVEVAREPAATIVPFEAIERRADVTGVFLVAAEDATAVWRPVELGIREGDRVQIIGENLSGRVIRLGQQLVEHGSPIAISTRSAGSAATSPSQNEDGAR